MEKANFKNSESISIYDEKYSNEVSPNDLTKEETSLNISDNLITKNKEIKSILDSKFYLIRKIGEGSSGKVYLGVQEESLKVQSDCITYYSIKLMNKEKIDLDVFKNEIELMEKVNHKNVCKIFAYGCGPKISLNKTKNKQPKDYYYIVMEYLEHNELLKYITNVEINENIGFGENFGRLIFSQLLDGLEALHNLNICHRDIKLNNIILGENGYILKYIDFGMATEDKGNLHTFLGTPYYVAPEIILKRPYCGKSEDIFLLGITLFILVTGSLPFKEASPNDSLYKYIARGDYVQFWKKKPMNISPSFMELIDNMIAFDYTQRPSISEIRQSNWMKEINWELASLLKQEFILREEKINYNKFIKSKKIEKNKFRTNKFKINMYDGTIVNSLFINKVNDNNKINKIEGNIIKKRTNKSLFNILFNIKKFLYRKGYFKFGGNNKKHEYNATNGDLDLFLLLEKYKVGYVKLSYSLTGHFQCLDKFNHLLEHINQILEK